jgi:hypothetical protein
MKSVSDLIEESTSDKKEHNYIEFYEKYFQPLREKELNILEIGIYRPPATEGILVGRTRARIPAASLKAWYEIFPNSQIYGADVDDFKNVDNDRISTFVLDQSNRSANKGLGILSSLGIEFDIIIDDGGHTMPQQQITLGYLFKYLKSGGIFVVEDLLTSYLLPTTYNPTKTRHSTLSILQALSEGNKISSDLMLPEEIDYLMENCESCVVEKSIGPAESEICFVTKK